VKHVLAWLVAWAALFWLWLLLAGDWNRIEWIGAASCATVAATIGEIARTRTGWEPRFPPAAVAASWNVVPQIFVDFGIVMWVLLRSVARREVVRGRVHTRKTDPRGSRAWTNYAAQFSPNAFVIDIDDERVVLHDLVMNRDSEAPA
jgi:hypothetical protein